MFALRHAPKLDPVSASPRLGGEGGTRSVTDEVLF